MKEPIYFGIVEHRKQLYNAVFKDSSKEIRITTKNGNIKITDFKIVEKKIVGYSNN